MAIDNIFNGVNEFLTILNNKNQDEYEKRVIGVESSTKSKSYYKSLERLEKSLEQYINKKRKLFYIGLMGIFSSGKSRTINSLLSLDSKNERDSDLQPTDIAITLITHTNNKQMLGHVATENQEVPIRSEFIDNEVLKNLVIVDTPGSGDPNILNEVVRDFLPICDLILYFFPAKPALTEADLPLLRKKQKDLPFIPMEFVITMGDNFRFEKYKPLNKENFNEKAFEKFLNKLLSRIKTNLGNLNISYQDFYLIDNEEQFQIENLRDIIVKKSNNQDGNELIAMHEHKIDYYNNQANRIKTFFINLINEKIKSFNEFDENLKNNIEAYSKTVNMTTINQSWSNYENNLKELLIDLNKRKLKEELKMPSDIWQLEELVEYSNNLKNQIIELTSHIVIKEIEKIHKKIEDEIYHPIEKLKTNIASLNINDINEDSLNKIFSTKIYLHMDTKIKITNTQQEDKLDRSIVDINRILTQLIQNINDKISSNYKSLIAITSQTSQNNYLLKKYQEIISNAQHSLNTELKEYFSKVEIYRAGVTSIGQNEILAKLKISEEIDKIQIPFDEDFKKRHHEKIKVELFPLYDDKKIECESELKKLYENNNNLFNDFKNEKFELTSKLETKDLNILNLDSKYLKDTIVDINNQIEKNLSISKERVIKNFKDKKIDFDKDIAKLKNKKIKKLTTIAILTFIITFGLSFSYIYFNFEITSTLTNIILTGVSSSLISTLVTYFFKRIKENTNKVNKKVIEKMFEEKIKSESNKILQEEFLEKEKYSIDGEKLQNEIQANLEEKIKNLKSYDIFSNFQSKYDILLNNYKLQIKQFDKYKNIFKEFHSNIISYFNSPDTNIKTLNDISDEIKKEVMLPSFNLFEKFKNRVEEIKEKIERITFL